MRLSASLSCWYSASLLPASRAFCVHSSTLLSSTCEFRLDRADAHLGGFPVLLLDGGERGLDVGDVLLEGDQPRVSRLPDEAAFGKLRLLLRKLLGHREVLLAVLVRLGLPFGVGGGLGLGQQFLVGEGLEAVEFGLEVRLPGLQIGEVLRGGRAQFLPVGHIVGLDEVLEILLALIALMAQPGQLRAIGALGAVIDASRAFHS